MRKNVLKVFAACAAVCFVSSLALFNNGVDSAKAAEAEVICNYTFDDGNYEGIIQNGSTTYTIEEGLNSNYNGGTGTACLKVVRGSDDDWWERAGVKFDLKKLTPGVQYKVAIDFYHESEAVMNGEEVKYDDMRAFKIGTYFTTGSSSTTTAQYGQIGSVMGAPKGEWEHIEGYITINEDVKAEGAGDYFMHVFMGYPEALGSGSSVGGYSDKGVLSEPYFIDNFSIVEVLKATPTPEPTATPTPTPAPTPEPTLAPVPEGPELEVGYEEAVKGIMYKVSGLDTVTVIGFDMPKSKLVIPDTVMIEGYAYKVTAIANNAFKGENIKNLTIGANVTTIGKNAFANCKSLKKVTIKSSVIKSIGKKAFVKTPKKATFKVPKAKKAAYKKLLKKAGINKKATVK